MDRWDHLGAPGHGHPYRAVAESAYRTVTAVVAVGESAYPTTTLVDRWDAVEHQIQKAAHRGGEFPTAEVRQGVVGDHRRGVAAHRLVGVDRAPAAGSAGGAGAFRLGGVVARTRRWR